MSATLAAPPLHARASAEPTLADVMSDAWAVIGTGVSTECPVCAGSQRSVASAAWATVPVAAPSQYTASLGSIQNFGGYLGAALAPTITGIVVQRTGSFSQALILSAGLALLSAIAYLLLVREPIPSNPRQ